MRIIRLSLKENLLCLPSKTSSTTTQSILIIFPLFGEPEARAKKFSASIELHSVLGIRYYWPFVMWDYVSFFGSPCILRSKKSLPLWNRQRNNNFEFYLRYWQIVFCWQFREIWDFSFRLELIKSHPWSWERLMIQYCGWWRAWKSFCSIRTLHELCDHNNRLDSWFAYQLPYHDLRLFSYVNRCMSKRFVDDEGAHSPSN